MLELAQSQGSFGAGRVDCLETSGVHRIFQRAALLLGCVKLPNKIVFQLH